MSWVCEITPTKAKIQRWDYDPQLARADGHGALGLEETIQRGIFAALTPAAEVQSGGAGVAAPPPPHPWLLRERRGRFLV